jgi:hypothetical protein
MSKKGRKAAVGYMEVNSPEFLDHQLRLIREQRAREEQARRPVIMRGQSDSRRAW